MSVSLKMSYDIEYINSENSARMDLFIDSDSDLVGLSYYDTIKLLQGSTAEDISTGDIYMMKSDNSWILQPSPNQLDLTGYYTSAETDTLLAGKQDSLTQTQLYAIDNSAAALPEIINAGSKNITHITLSAGTYSSSGINYTVNSGQTEVLAENTATGTSYLIIQTLSIKEGTYVLSGCPSGGSDSTYKIRLGDADNANAFIAQDIGNSQEFTLNRDYNMYVAIYIYSAAGNVNLTFKPMICTKTDWNISNAYVPYCPSLYDLYQLVLSYHP